MISEKFLLDLSIALQTQTHLLNKLNTAVAEVDASLTESTATISRLCDMTQQLRELEGLMDEIEAEQNWIEAEDFGDFDPDQILRLYENRQRSIFRELDKIGFTDWDSFVRQCQAYSVLQGCDAFAPYDVFLTDADRKNLEIGPYYRQYAWDKWDYIFVGASGVLASLTDYLLVRIPMTLTTGEYANQVGSPITEWLKRYDTTSSNDWFAQWAENLSERCKVPYDSMNYTSPDGVSNIAGMFPKSHRFQSLGHDPVLGFVFGVLDIMRGTITGFSYDKLSQTHTWIQETAWTNLEPVGLIDAMLRHLGHLVSDVATPMGLPAPFMALIQGMNIGSFGEGNRTVGEIARWMYLNGYDFRHFLVSGITPAVIEITLRAYIMLRHYSEYGATKFRLASHPKYRTMLLMAHGIATLGNTGKILLMQGNPLAINYAEWLALTRYLVPSIKYWVFGQTPLPIENWDHIRSESWDQLLQNSDHLLETVVNIDKDPFTLGIRAKPL